MKTLINVAFNILNENKKHDALFKKQTSNSKQTTQVKFITRSIALPSIVINQTPSNTNKYNIKRIKMN